MTERSPARPPPPEPSGPPATAPTPAAAPACSLGDPTSGPQPFCPVCGHRGPLVWIHGEGRCARCGTVLDTCCSGAPLGGFED